MPPIGYTDDPSVGDDEEIWRRIPVDMVIQDSATNELRPQSGMFGDSRDGSPMSAHRAQCYGSPGEANTGGYLLVGLTVRCLRTLRLGVATRPTTADPGHVWIVGNKTASIKKKLAKHAYWVIPPAIADD